MSGDRERGHKFCWNIFAELKKIKSDLSHDAENFKSAFSMLVFLKSPKSQK